MKQCYSNQLGVILVEWERGSTKTTVAQGYFDLQHYFCLSQKSPTLIPPDVLFMNFSNKNLTLNIVLFQGNLSRSVVVCLFPSLKFVLPLS